VTRLAPLPAEALDADQRALRESVTTSRGLAVGPGTALPGPFEAWLRAPRPGLAAARLGEALGAARDIDPAARELAILVVAARYRVAIVFSAHARLARRLGVDPEVIELIRAGEVPPDAACQVADQLVTAGRLDDEPYGRAVAELGESGLIELVLSIGYYMLVALTVNTAGPAAW